MAGTTPPTTAVHRDPLTRSPSGNRIEYVIWPTSSKNTEETKQTAAAIRQIVGSDVEIGDYISEDEGLLLWFCFLTEKQLEAVRSLPGVSPSPTWLYCKQKERCRSGFFV